MSLVVIFIAAMMFVLVVFHVGQERASQPRQVYVVQQPRRRSGCALLGMFLLGALMMLGLIAALSA